MEIGDQKSKIPNQKSKIQNSLLRIVNAGCIPPYIKRANGETAEIERAYWGQTTLPRLWGQHVFNLAKTIYEGSPESKIYWYLISSGYKTYRFLSVFFREFYPTYRCVTPTHLKQLLDKLGQLKFPTEYDPTTGIIHPRQATPLQADVAKITTQRLKDPHVAFFVKANPNHIHGDELACLTELTYANLTSAGRRSGGF